MPFSAFTLNTRILKAIEELGYEKATPIQQKAIPAIQTGKDVIGIAQTGTGKTAAFCIPLLSDYCEQTSPTDENFTKLVIITPTRELATQIYENIRSLGKFTNLRAVTVIGGASEKHQIEKLQSNVDIVVATPGRLLALMDSGHCNFGKITHLILDEADRMLDMGFLPDVSEIIKLLPNKRQSLLFSATLNKHVQKLSRSFLTDPQVVEVDRQNEAADTVEQALYPVAKHLKLPLLLALLEDHQFYSVIVFVRTKQDAEVLMKDLRREKVDTEAIHGDRTQNSRLRALRDFKAGKIRVLVATDVASRGLDISGVTHVVNFDFPENSEDYIHRIGRTGRAGEEGHALTFFTKYDGDAYKKLEKHTGKTLKKQYLDGFNYDAPLSDDDSNSRPSPTRKSSKKNTRTRQRNDFKYGNSVRGKQSRGDQTGRSKGNRNER